MTHAEQALHDAYKSIEHYKRLLSGSMSDRQRAMAESRLHIERGRYVRLFFAVKDEQQEVVNEMVAA